MTALRIWTLVFLFVRFYTIWTLPLEKTNFRYGRQSNATTSGTFSSNSGSQLIQQLTNPAASSGSSGTSLTGSQVIPPQQLINPAASSGSPSVQSTGNGNQVMPQKQLTNPAGTSGSSQQLSQQFSPSSFVDPSFQASAVVGSGSGSNNTQQSSQQPSFINPSIFLQPGTITGGGGGSNRTSGGSGPLQPGIPSGTQGSGGFQFFQPPQQFFGQSAKFSFFNPASFINGRK